MANKSAEVLEEGSCDEESILIAEPYAGFRDLLFMTVGFSAFAFILFLLTIFDFLPHFSQFFPHENLHGVQARCHDPSTRREWRTLKEDEKLDFISAIQCLAHHPSKLGLQTTRYDDFVYVHVKMYSNTHNVAPSLPWHRYYIKIFENALREECDFKDHLPYWDWTLDAAAPEESPIWSITNGFGGNGTGNAHCLDNGPFVDFKPQYAYKHCLQREFIPGMNGFNYTTENIHNLWQNTTSYHDFRSHLESGAHKSVHNGIGGEMPSHGSSNDPIFFVHHAQIDRIWWYWQQLQPTQRLEDYFGPNNISEPNALSQANLQDMLVMMDLDADRAVADVMDTRSNILCYKY